MFINDAMAQTATNVAPQASVQSTMGSVIMLAVFLVVFYFFVYKPQADQAKKQKEIINNIKKGDVVVLASGIIGKVEKIHSDEIILIEIAENCVIRVERDKVAEIVDKKHFVKVSTTTNEKKKDK